MICYRVYLSPTTDYCRDFATLAEANVCSELNQPAAYPPLQVIDGVEQWPLREDGKPDVDYVFREWLPRQGQQMPEN